MKIVFSLLLIIFLLGGVFWLGSVVDAQNTVVPKCSCNKGSEGKSCSGTCASGQTDCDPADCVKMCCGTYGVNDIMNLVVKTANMVFGFVGSLVLLFFIYGGFLFLTAAGRNEQVAKGKRVITGSIVGLLIVFFSYTIVGFVFSKLDVKNANIFYSSTWFQKQK